MQTVWQGRLSQAAARYGEIAPTATVCCNACRTCVQTNLLALTMAGIASGGVAVVSFVKRLGGRS